MAFTKRDQEKLDALYVTLVGINGNPGFLSRFEELAKSSVKSINIAGTIISHAIRKTVKIVNEIELIKAIKAKKLGKAYLREAIAPEFESVRRELAKTGDEVWPGMERVESAYVSIRTKKE